MRALVAAPAAPLYDLYVYQGGRGRGWLLVAPGLTLGEAYERAEEYRNNGKAVECRPAAQS